MTIVNTDVISVVDDKKAVGVDLSDSLFDYDMLLKDVENKNNIFDGLFDQGNAMSNPSSSLSSGSPQQLIEPKRPKLMQWGPQEGRESTSIVSIVMEHNEQAAPMKIVFGVMTAETAQQQHMLTNNTENDQPSVWITLVASVPQWKDTQSDSNHVKVSICQFDRTDVDLAVDTWDIGYFTYQDTDEDTGQVNKNSRKRALSCEPEEGAHKRHTYDIKTEPSTDHERQEEVNSQLLKLLAPYDPLLEGTSNELPTEEWMHSTSNQSNYSTTSSSGSGSSGSNTSSSATHPFSLPVNHMLIQQNMLHSRHHSNHNNLFSHSQESGLFTNVSQKHEMYRIYLEMQQRQRQSNPFMQANNNSLPPYMGNYMNQISNSSHVLNNSSILYNMAEHQRQTQQYHRLQQQHQEQKQRQLSLSGPYQDPAVGLSPPLHVPRHNSAPNINYVPPSNNNCALNKVHLKLNGDLMDMVVNWSMPEFHSGRRLVHFWRRTTAATEGSPSMVDCGFEPMDQQAYHQQRMRENVVAVAAAAAAASVNGGSPAKLLDIKGGGLDINGGSSSGGSRLHHTSPIVVSCIYWREKNDYFITSVDCIYLLESLIGMQFTVEEKNRIRRNLEGFRPLTVSKCKVECADFFKLIMSFPHPKPRNIEKDVKVFSWKTLPHALRKIIRKYTPSYITSTPLEPIQHNQPRSTLPKANNSHNNLTSSTEYTPIAASIQPALDRGF